MYPFKNKSFQRCLKEYDVRTKMPHLNKMITMSCAECERKNMYEKI